jgi:radical SAM superfamily enzyme YgiQ (UPF0313 family)
MRKFRLLFINVIDDKIKFQSSYPSLGIGYLISYLLREIKDIDILVIQDNFYKSFKSFKPDCVALSSVTQNFNKAKEVAKIVKEWNYHCPVVVGGIHISQLPYTLEQNMDIGVIGEGEETFLMVMKQLISSNSYPKDLCNIAGLIFRHDGQLVMTEQRKFISILDTIPHPVRSVLPHNENQLLLTSRGCPYKCTFCASSHFWQAVRYFSSDYVIEEIEHIIKHYPVLNILIFDDLFVFNLKRLEEISSEIVKKGYHKKVSFSCNARPNHITKESIEYLKRMNVKTIAMGLESGSNRILTSLKGEEISVEINKRAIDLCKENGLFVHGSFMLGCPDETEEDMFKTRDFIKNSGIDKGDISLAAALPGTQFWAYASKKGLVSNEMDWSKLAIKSADDMPQDDDFILLSDEISRQSLLNIFREIGSVLLLKRNEYEKKWDIFQGQQIRVKKIFSPKALRKAWRDPVRGWRYAKSYLGNLPSRIFNRNTRSQ